MTKIDWSRLEAPGKIIEVNPQGDRLQVMLDDCIFYPGGGGQPYDLGIISNDSFSGDVVEMIKENGNVTLIIAPIEGSLQAGDTLIQKVDEARRSELARMHSAEHLLFGCIHETLKEVNVVKVELEPGESTLFIKTKEDVDWERLVKIEVLVNEKIKADLPLTEHIVARDKAQETFPKARIRLDRIKAEELRVIEIDGFDFSACGGTHVRSTGDIKNVLITGFNAIGADQYEIRFTLDVMHALYQLAGIARQVSGVLGIEYDRVIERITGLLKTAEQQKEKLRTLQSQASVEPERIGIGDTTLLFHVFSDYEKKQLIEQANRLKADKTVVCLLNQTDKGTQVVVVCGDGVKKDAPAILAELNSRFGGRSGGRGDFAMGSVEKDDIESIKKTIQETLGGDTS
ncbi:MAG: DHHA1 domain-containing protein [archaeon]